MLSSSQQTTASENLRFTTVDCDLSVPDHSGIFEISLSEPPGLSDADFPSLRLRFPENANQVEHKYLVFRNDVEFAAGQLWQKIKESRVSACAYSSGHLLKPNSGEFLGSFAAAKFAQAVTSSAGPDFPTFMRIFEPLYKSFGDFVMKTIFEMQQISNPVSTRRIFYYSVDKMNDWLAAGLRFDGDEPLICLDPTQKLEGFPSAAWLSSRCVDRSGLAKSQTPIASPGAEPIESQIREISDLVGLGQGIRLVDDGVEGGGTLNRLRKFLAQRNQKIVGKIKAFVGVNTGTIDKLAKESIFLPEAQPTTIMEKAITLRPILAFISEVEGGQQEFRDFCLLDGQAASIAGDRDYRKIKLGPFVNPGTDLGFNEELGDDFSRKILLEAAKMYSKLESEIQAFEVGAERPYHDFRVTLNDINPHVARWLKQSELQPLPYRRIADVILDLISNYDHVKLSETRLSEESAILYSKLGVRLDSKGLIFIDGDALLEDSHALKADSGKNVSKLLRQINFLEEKLSVQVGIWSDAPFDHRSIKVAKLFNLSGPIIAAAGGTWTNCHGKNITYLGNQGIIGDLENKIRTVLADKDEVRIEGEEWKSTLINFSRQNWGFVNLGKCSGVCKLVLPSELYFDRFSALSQAISLNNDELGRIHLRHDSTPFRAGAKAFMIVEVALTDKSRSRRQTVMRKISATTGQIVHSVSSRYGAIERHSPSCHLDPNLSEPNTASVPRFRQSSEEKEDIAAAITAMLEMIIKDIST